MPKKLLAQVRRLQFVADWLDLRQASREEQRLKAECEADRKKRGEDAQVWSEYTDELRMIWDPINVRQSNKLVARARKCGVRVPRLPTHQTRGDTTWEWSDVAQDWMLTAEAQEQIRREIKDEQRRSEDELRKRATMVISVAAFVLALVSLIVKGKQRDPCPKNYYRNDRGECVFALQQKPTSQPQQSAIPTPSVQPKKPSPANPKP